MSNKYYLMLRLSEIRFTLDTPVAMAGDPEFTGQCFWGDLQIDIMTDYESDDVDIFASYFSATEMVIMLRSEVSRNLDSETRRNRCLRKHQDILDAILGQTRSSLTVTTKELIPYKGDLNV